MSDSETPQDMLEARLAPILKLLTRGQIIEDLSRRQSPNRQDLVESLAHRQWLGELEHRIVAQEPADIAHLLEMLPPRRRALVWNLVPTDKAGDVLWEVTDQVAEAVVAETDSDRLRAICAAADTDAISRIAEHLPGDVLAAVNAAMEAPVRTWLRTYTAFPEGTVGRLMSREVVVTEQTASVRDVLKTLRTLDRFPDQMDALYVVDDRDRLVGALPIHTLLLHRPGQIVGAIMDTDTIRFRPADEADETARAFERYDLVSAPVVDERGRLVGRVTVDAIMDFVRETAEDQALKREGLSADEDLFAPIWRGARRRWLWLSVNLLTAFLASRVIGLFEGSIERLVALATLMPIVASVGGNTGNQTVALIIRGLALDQINSGNLRYLARKELAVSAINGLIWGSVMGSVAWGLYGDPALGAVMMGAMLLNLLLAATVGIAVPVVMDKMGRDPAFGSSVLLTFMTDSMGFFIFLGLATVFLLH